MHHSVFVGFYCRFAFSLRKRIAKPSCIASYAGWTNFPWLDFALYATLAQNRSTPNLPHMAALNAPRIEAMEFEEELESKSAPRIKKAAAKISKGRVDGHESLLLSSLKYLIEKPKSWQAQSEVIKAIGITGTEKSLPYLKELSKKEFESTVLYRDLGFSICLIEDISGGKLNYTASILDTSNDLLLSGACAAILFSGYTPSSEDIVKIIDTVAERDQNEGKVITPRCYIAAACYSWPAEITESFLQKCASSSWSGLVEIANDSLAGKKSKYVLI